MTKQPDSHIASLDRPTLTDVVITPQMIEAGVSIFCDYEDGAGELPSALVARLFRAMFAVGPSSQFGQDK